MRNPSTSRVLSEEELIASYLEVARKDVADLEALSAQLRQDPAAWLTVRPTVYRIVHNVKGQGTSFGYPLMTRIGESLMRLVKIAEESAAPDPRLLGAHVAALRTVLQHDIRGRGGASGDALAEKLESLVAATLG